MKLKSQKQIYTVFWIGSSSFVLFLFCTVNNFCYALLFILQHFHAYSKMWLCVPALLCFVSFSFWFFFLFSACAFVLLLPASGACYLVSPMPYFRFMRHLLDEHTHITLCYTMNSQEHRMNGNTNVLHVPSLPPPTKIRFQISFSNVRSRNILRI